MVQNPNSEPLSMQKVGERLQSIIFKDDFPLFTLFMLFWEGFLKEVEEGMIWPLVNSSQWCGGGMGSLGEAGPRLIRT